MLDAIRYVRPNLHDGYIVGNGRMYAVAGLGQTMARIGKSQLTPQKAPLSKLSWIIGPTYTIGNLGYGWQVEAAVDGRPVEWQKEAVVEPTRQSPFWGVRSDHEELKCVLHDVMVPDSAVMMRCIRLQRPDVLPPARVTVTLPVHPDPRNGYSGQAWGWNSYAEMMALQLDYERDVMPVNPNVSFSLRNRVPVSHFLSKIPTTPGNSGEKDYAIAAAWNREQGIQRLNGLGLPATELLASLNTDYRLSDFCPVAPHAIEAAARTYNDPSWRSDKPLALVVFNRELLYDGAFTEADIIGTLAWTHRLVVAQSYDAPSFLAAAGKAHQRNGKFDVVVLCGHGNEAQASVFDIANTNAFAELDTMLTPGATVLLASCLGAHFNPWFVQARVNGGHSTIHVAAAMQAAMPSARVVAASDKINRAMLRYDATATKPEERYRVAFQGGHAYGDVPGLAPRGTPRDWLRREFGPTEDWAALENADSDGDGQPNWQEYRAGTNPRSASDVFKISELQIAGGQAEIRWTGSCRNEQAAPFTVFKTTTLATGDWQAISSGTVRAAFGDNHWTNFAAAGPVAFYRLGVPAGSN